MNKQYGFIVFFCLTLCSENSHAQTINRVLGVDELFRLADESSSSIKSFTTKKEALDESLKAAKAQRLPDISSSLSFSYLGNGNIWDRDFSNAHSVYIPHFGNNFTLEASQVIYAGGAVSSGIALAELEQQMAALDLQKNRQEIRFLLTGYYLNLYQLNNQLKVLDKNIELTKQLIKNMQNRCQQGTVLTRDITRYQLQLENQNLQRVRILDTRKIMNHQLVTTLHLPAETEIVPDTTLLSNKIVENLSETDWQQLALTNNSNLHQADLAVRINEQRVKLQRSEFLPKVALVAADHLDGPVTIEVPALDNNFNYWYVGVGVKYSLSSLFKNNNKLKQAKLEKRKAQTDHVLAQEQIGNAVQTGYVNLLTSFTDLHTQEKSVELANQNYAVTNNRYRNELALLTDMLDAANMKLGAELDLVNARIQVLFNYYKMKYITHTL